MSTALFKAEDSLSRLDVLFLLIMKTESCVVVVLGKYSGEWAREPAPHCHYSCNEKHRRK